MSYVPIQGQGGTGVFEPQSIKPMDIAVGNQNVWIYDTFDYDVIAPIDEKYIFVGSGAHAFNNVASRVELTVGAIVGESSQMLVSRELRTPLTLQDRAWFWRVGFGKVPGSNPLHFAGVNVVNGSPEGDLNLAAALASLGDCVIIYASSGNGTWICRNVSGGVATETDTGIIAGQATTLEARLTITGIAYFINGVLVAAHTTNIPLNLTGRLRVGLVALAAAGSTARVHQVTGATNRQVLI